MNVPLLDLKAQYATIREEIRGAVDRVLESQRFILGEEVTRLEEEIAAYCGVSHAIAVASGTDALLLSLKALGVGNGDLVVTVPYTFFATAGAISNLGARPAFVDIERESFNLDVGKLSEFFERECSFSLSSRKVTHKPTDLTVKAIVPVHLYGQCADMDEISETAARYHLPVVEDACQAIGARYRSSRAGTMGDLGCLSFFPSKNLGGAGDGGMILARGKELADRVRLLRTHGARSKYHHTIVGFNSRLDELQAAILRVKLRHLDGWTSARREKAACYGREFEAAGLAAHVQAPATRPDRDHIFHQFVIRCRNRDKLREFLASRGIGTEVYYPVPLHEQECFRCLGYAPRDFPQAHQAARETLALPVYPELAAEQQRFVAESLAEFYSDAPMTKG